MGLNYILAETSPDPYMKMKVWRTSYTIYRLSQWLFMIPYWINSIPVQN